MDTVLLRQQRANLRRERCQERRLPVCHEQRTSLGIEDHMSGSRADVTLTWYDDVLLQTIISNRVVDKVYVGSGRAVCRIGRAALAVVGR